MRCEEIREHFIDFVYDEGVDSPASVEVREHLRTCSACRGEFEELRSTRKYLQLWKDEAPLRNVLIAGVDATVPRKFGWKYLRYAAIAAMAALCFLALANTQIAWNSNGFKFSTRFFGGRESPRDYYTKSEVLDIIDDSEYHMTETSLLMIQKMIDTVETAEQDRWADLRLVRGHEASTQNKN